MGTNESKLTIAQNIQYNGSIHNDLPHGNGTIVIYENHSHQKQKTKIQAKFHQAKILQARVYNNNLIYEGTISNQKITGTGKLMYKSTIFNGQVIDGIAKIGKIEKQNEFICNGNFIELDNSEKHSSSTDQSEGVKTLLLDGQSSYHRLIQKQKLEGKFYHGELNGKGKYKFNNGDIFEGHFKGGFICGEGIYTSKSSGFTKITSNFQNSKPHSSEGGKIQFKNGDCYEGPLLNGSMHGSSGKYTFSNGTVYKGEFYHNSMTGDCQINFSSDSQMQIYKGEVSQGLFNGLGVVEYRNGVILKGYFLKHKKNGPSLIIYGDRMFKCLFVMDEIVGNLTEVQQN